MSYLGSIPFFVVIYKANLPRCRYVLTKDCIQIFAILRMCVYKVTNQHLRWVKVSSDWKTFNKKSTLKSLIIHKHTLCVQTLCKTFKLLPLNIYR